MKIIGPYAIVEPVGPCDGVVVDLAPSPGWVEDGSDWYCLKQLAVGDRVSFDCNAETWAGVEGSPLRAIRGRAIIAVLERAGAKP